MFACSRCQGDVKPVQQKEPFESVTSYRSEYVVHPLPPRTRRENPAQQNTRGGLDHVARPATTGGMMHELLRNFSKFQGEADQNRFVSTTHAHYVPHTCRRTEPVLPTVQGTWTSKEPFQGLTTMREDYKAWASREPGPQATPGGPHPAGTTAVCSLHWFSVGEASRMYWSTCLQGGGSSEEPARVFSCIAASRS